MSRYRAELEQDDDGRWSAWIDELPGCAAWEYTREEALVALKHAAVVYIKDMVESGEAKASVREGSSVRVESKL